jgi:hypothetical protein
MIAGLMDIAWGVWFASFNPIKREFYSEKKPSYSTSTSSMRMLKCCSDSGIRA